MKKIEGNNANTTLIAIRALSGCSISAPPVDSIEPKAPNIADASATAIPEANLYIN